jgi:plastocyanin
MTRRLLAALIGLLAALLSSLVLAAPAQAAVTKVSLTPSGPSPATVTIKAGDTVAFTNTDTVTHTLQSTSSNWTLKATRLAPRSTKSVAFTKSGTFDYSDTYTFVAVPQTFPGHVVVPAAPSPSPTPRTTASTSPRPVASPTARPVVSASPSAVPSASGFAVPPPITGGVIPTPSPTSSVGPVPQVASPGATPDSPSTSPVANVDYGSPRGIVQGSSHGFGLPAALAVVALVGVASLLVRLLLNAPEAGRGVR